MVGPYRGVLPEAVVTQMEEQLSGACTVEIAGFNEFSKRLADDTTMQVYDHVVLDTAPTGHTLRLLTLPSAWNDFIASNQTGSSCLGPVAGLKEQKIMFEQVVAALKDPERTLLVMICRAEAMTFQEARRASSELGELGLKNQHLIVNGVFTSASDDPVAVAFAEKSSIAMAAMPKELKALPSTVVPFRPAGVMGIKALSQDCIIKNLDRTKTYQRHFFDFIIVDSPATGHGLSWFSVPDAVLTTFLVGPLNKKAREIKKIWLDEQLTSIHLVTLPEEMPVNETAEFYQSLTEKLGLPVRNIILNGIYPELNGEQTRYPHLDELLSSAAFSSADPSATGNSDFSDILPYIQRSAQFYRSRRKLNEYYKSILSSRIQLPMLELPMIFDKKSPISLIEELSRLL